MRQAKAAAVRARPSSELPLFLCGLESCIGELDQVGLQKVMRFLNAKQWGRVKPDLILSLDVRAFDRSTARRCFHGENSSLLDDYNDDEEIWGSNSDTDGSEY